MGACKRGSRLVGLVIFFGAGGLPSCTYDYDRFSSLDDGPGSGGESPLGGTTSSLVQSPIGGNKTSGGTTAIAIATGGGSEADSSTSQSSTASSSTGGSPSSGSSLGGHASGGTSGHAGSSSVDAGQGGSSEPDSGEGGSATGGTSSGTSSTVAECRRDSDCGSSSEANCDEPLCVCSGTECKLGEVCHRHGNRQECGEP